MSNQSKFTEEELLFFRDLLTKKKSEALTLIGNYELQLVELSENGKDENSLENSGFMQQKEYLSNATDRSKKHLLHIENALLRIKNGIYGFCAETQERIDIDRLKAVPTTTLSLKGKRIREIKSGRV